MKKKSLPLILAIAFSLALAAPSFGAMSTTTHGAPKPAYDDSGEAKAAEFNSAMDAFDAAIWSALGGLSPAASRVTIASSATPTPVVGTAGADIFYAITALAEDAEFQVPTGTPQDFQLMIIRIKDDGTSRVLTWNAAYQEGPEFSLPSATVISETVYLSFRYNAADGVYNLVGRSDGH